VQLLYLLATAAAFDVWEQRHKCASMGEGKGIDEMDRQCTVRGLLHAYQDQAAVAWNEITK